MKTKNRIALILCSSLLIAGGGAQARDRSGDALLGGLFGGGVGAVIGNHVGGRDGAIIGGALGAATGVAITTDRGHRERYVEAPAYRPVRERYVAAPVYVQPRPVAYYSPQVIYVEQRGHGYYEHHGYRHDRYNWDNRGGWRSEHHDDDDHDDDGRRNYRDWD
ncbi:MAG TPA: hypothetical protein VIM43_06805 [Rugosibacter sp.]